MALSTMSRVRRPCISATIATPHAFMFERGVVQPLTAGRHSHYPFLRHAFVKLRKAAVNDGH